MREVKGRRENGRQVKQLRAKNCEGQVTQEIFRLTDGQTNKQTGRQPGYDIFQDGALKKLTRRRQCW